MSSKKLIYPSHKSLTHVRHILEEADEGLKHDGRVINNSSIPEILGALAGGGVGIGAGLMLVSTAAAETAVGASVITSGLATLGGLVGGGMMAGVFVAAAPMAVLGVGGYALVSSRNEKILSIIKQELLREAVQKQNLIIQELKNTAESQAERIEYLTQLNAVLQQVVKDLRADLAA